MNADKKRFVTVTELTKRLGLKPSEAVRAMNIAQKADATMKIGIKVWYDWEKALEYKEAHPEIDKASIKWLGMEKKVPIRKDPTKVRISINKTAGKKRLRFAIPMNLVDKKYDINKDRLMCGIYENMMFFSFTKDEGFAMEKTNKSFYAATIRCEEDYNSWIGEYTLHKEDDGLYYIVAEEKEKTK